MYHDGRTIRALSGSTVGRGKCGRDLSKVCDHTGCYETVPGAHSPGCWGHGCCFPETERAGYYPWTDSDEDSVPDKNKELHDAIVSAVESLAGLSEKLKAVASSLHTGDKPGIKKRTPRINHQDDIDDPNDPDNPCPGAY